MTLFLLLLTLSFRLIDRVYYSSYEQILIFLKLELSNKHPVSYYKKFDPLFTIFPFLWSWLDISIAAMVLNNYPTIFMKIVAIVFVGTRMRALQEVAHTAVHGGLCKSRKWQWEIANIFFQFPMLKPDMFFRFKSHVIAHHQHPNQIDKDPNIDRFINVGFLPGMSSSAFYFNLFYPLTIRGFKETMITIAKNFTLNQTTWHLIIRAIVVTITVSYFYITFHLTGLVFAYLLPLMITYPLFSWISLLAEHRWFAPCEAVNRHSLECINGRPTDYPGIIGWITKHSIFPGTDHYHLAHSLFPLIRWNYMAIIDKVLKEKDTEYSQYLSSGLVWSRLNQHSALSELHDRMTLKEGHKLAAWSEKLRIKQ